MQMTNIISNMQNMNMEMLNMLNQMQMMNQMNNEMIPNNNNINETKEFIYLIFFRFNNGKTIFVNISNEKTVEEQIYKR